jgi:hypothetical protein
MGGTYHSLKVVSVYKTNLLLSLLQTFCHNLPSLPPPSGHSLTQNTARNKYLSMPCPGHYWVYNKIAVSLHLGHRDGAQLLQYSHAGSAGASPLIVLTRMVGSI